MSNQDEHVQEPVPAELYDSDYFRDVEGYETFARSRGATASTRVQAALNVAEIEPGQRVLDIGCGRGEVLVQSAMHHAALAVGVDYATASVEIARRTVAEHGLAGVAHVSQANCKTLPFPDDYFDRVFMLDLVEHLHPWELDETVTQVRRVLKPGGRCIIHTMPNLWYYRFGYPLYRAVKRSQGEELPADPRQRFRYHAAMHVNEQDIVRLRRTLQKAGFASRVWVTSLDSYSARYGRLGKLADVLSRFYPLRWILCNDILAVATVPVD
ncbi:MAG: methyltransferase domain-containing protein [Anaerolineae bacterium]|nr:methyltransferase domain-containing protein [Anaerolineae bacterium]